MIYINKQLEQFKDEHGVVKVENMLQAYPLLYEEVARKNEFGLFVKETQKIGEIAITFDETGENILVQTELMDKLAVKKALDTFIRENIIRYEAELKKVRTRLVTLYSAKGE